MMVQFGSGIVCVEIAAYKEFMPHDEYCLLLCGSKMSLKELLQVVEEEIYS